MAALDALGEPPFARARFVTGHLPHRPPDAFDGADPAPVTLLRDPVARMLSHYRYGVERGGWTEDASLARLVEDGRLCNNLQTRQLAGCLDAREPCDNAMLARAQENLAAHYAVVGQTENFDGFLAALIALFGWPELLYGRRQVTSRRLVTWRRRSRMRPGTSTASTLDSSPRCVRRAIPGSTGSIRAGRRRAPATPWS